VINMRFIFCVVALATLFSNVASAGTFIATMSGAQDASGTVNRPSGTFPGSMYNSLNTSRTGFGSFATNAVGGYAINYETAFDGNASNQTVPNAQVRTDSSTFQAGDSRYLNLTTYSGMLNPTGTSSVRNAFVVAFSYKVDANFDYIYNATVNQDNLAAINATNPGHGSRTYGIYKSADLTRPVLADAGVYKLASNIQYYLLVEHESGSRLWTESLTGANLIFKLDQFNTGAPVPEPGTMAVFGLLGLAGAASKFRRKK
jgi:hypothetical protein